MSATNSHAVDPVLAAARDLALGGMLGAMAVALPMAFHAVPQGGAVFLPMHYPILALGLLASPPIAFIVGAIVPVLSSLLTGMPPLAPTAGLMSVELATLGGATALISSALPRRLALRPWLAALGGMAGAKLALGLAVAALGAAIGFDRAPYEYVAFVVAVGAPGLLVQATAIPLMITWLRRVGAIGT